MPSFDSFSPLDRADEPSSIKRAIAAAVLIGAFIAIFAFGPRLDPSKVVAGLPCSVLSENAIGAVLGTQVRLMPSSGTVCQYVASSSGNGLSVFVVARRDPAPPPDGTRVVVPGLDGTALRVGDTLFVRSGNHAYSLAVVPRTLGGHENFAAELQLASLLRRGTLAQNR